MKKAEFFCRLLVASTTKLTYSVERRKKTTVTRNWPCLTFDNWRYVYVLAGFRLSSVSKHDILTDSWD